MADHKLLDPPARDAEKAAEAREESAYLERLEQLAAAGGHGVDLGEMDDDEIRARLLGR